MEVEYFTIGRIGNSGEFTVVGAPTESAVTDVSELVCQSEPMKRDSKDAEELVKHIKEQIELNAPHQTPVALADNAAITYHEAVKALPMIEAIISGAVDANAGNQTMEPQE